MTTLRMHRRMTPCEKVSKVLKQGLIGGAIGLGVSWTESMLNLLILSKEDDVIARLMFVAASTLGGTLFGFAYGAASGTDEVINAEKAQAQRVATRGHEALSEEKAQARTQRAANRGHEVSNEEKVQVHTGHSAGRAGEEKIEEQRPRLRH